MIGAELLHRLYQLISESSSSGWIDRKTSFDFLFEAAKDFAKETKTVHSTQTIATVANQAAYSLNPDFMEVITDDGYDNKVIKYSDGTNTTWLSWDTYKAVLSNDNSTSRYIPSSYTITDESPKAQITGTSGATAASTGGESVLSADSFTGVSAGDDVYNVTTGYMGKVLITPTTTSITTAMFDITSAGSPAVGWTVADSYIIQPAQSYQLILDPAPETSGHTVTVTHLARPVPVYSDYRSYPLATGYEEAILKYAVWLYKYRDSKPSYGDVLYKAYDLQVRKAKGVNKQAVGARGFKVSFIKR